TGRRSCASKPGRLPFRYSFDRHFPWLRASARPRHGFDAAIRKRRQVPMAIEEAQAPARGHDRLAGKIAVVTGATRGIGEAVARCFVAEGARVVMADISRSGADLAASLGSAAFFVKADATTGADWETLVGLAGEQLRGIDILVNNAGAGAGVGQLIDESEDRHRHVVELNLTSAWLGIRHVAPVMARRGGGAIVNISSMDGLVGIAGMASYSAAKF